MTALLKPGAPAGEINAAIRAVEARRPYTPTDDALASLLSLIVHRHRHVPETEEWVAMCTCGEEWVCPELVAAMTLAAAIREGARS
ncbi:hypothetical protein ACQEU3_47215 [Spirillospora sp. CA-253888]